MLGLSSKTPARILALGAIALIGQQVYKSYRRHFVDLDDDEDEDEESQDNLNASPHSFDSTTRSDRDLTQTDDRWDQIIEDSFPASDPPPLR